MIRQFIHALFYFFFPFHTPGTTPIHVYWRFSLDSTILPGTLQERIVLIPIMHRYRFPAEKWKQFSPQTGKSANKKFGELKFSLFLVRVFLFKFKEFYLHFANTVLLIIFFYMKITDGLSLWRSEGRERNEIDWWWFALSWYLKTSIFHHNLLPSSSCSLPLFHVFLFCFCFASWHEPECEW